jgi:hypothetical protein
VVFLSNPLADPVSWSAPVRGERLELGYRVTTFEHRPQKLDWGSAVRVWETSGYPTRRGSALT